MAEDRLYNSLVAEAVCASGRHVVYGYRLRAFSLLHSLQLSLLENPIWVGTGADPEDLLIAAQICASDEMVVDFELATGEFDPVAELDKWLSYLRDCAGKPRLKQRVISGFHESFGVAIELQAVVFLMRECRIDERRAWRMPYGLAWWYVDCARDQAAGDPMIMTQEEEEFLESINTPEAISRREEMEANAGWIVEHIKDVALRQDLLNKAARGELTEGWKESLNG